MVKRLGIVLLLLPAITLYLLVSYLLGLWGWFDSLIVIAIAVAWAFLLFVYFVRLRAAEGFFDKANDPTATLTFTTEGVRTESDLGSSDLKWQVFDEILKFRDFWLLVYAKSGYMTLPVDQITPECSQFVDQQIASHRKVSVART